METSRHPSAPDVAGLLDDLAAQSPHEICISAEAEEVTFGQLRQRVISRAYSVRAALGTSQPDDVLPVLVDYSVESVINVIACLWLQRPFSPIDITTAPKRLATVLGLLGAEKHILVPDPLTTETLPDRFTAIPFMTDGKDCSPYFPAPDDVGVVVMTSGSTGTPKGVTIPWSTIAFRIADYFDSLGRNELPLRFSSLAPLNFVAGLLQVFLLLRGGHMVRINPRSSSPRGLLDQLSHSDLTHLFLPSQLFRLMAQLMAGSGVSFPECRLMSVGGESVRYEDLARFRQVLPRGVVFRHVLGATESMTFLSYFVDLDSAPAIGQVPVGTSELPATTKLVACDSELFEAWCSGPIARGYLGDDEAEQRNFTADSHGVVWWKSGDVVSRDNEGNLIHRGRLDDLVKIQGKLASPSELTHQLLHCPGVKGAVVLVTEGDASPHFVAHLEVDAVESFDRAQLRRVLGRALDSHLIPRRIELWESFPVNQHGKVDRKALGGQKTEEAPP